MNATGYGTDTVSFLWSLSRNSIDVLLISLKILCCLIFSRFLVIFLIRSVWNRNFACIPNQYLEWVRNWNSFSNKLSRNTLISLYGMDCIFCSDPRLIYIYVWIWFLFNSTWNSFCSVDALELKANPHLYACVPNRHCWNPQTTRTHIFIFIVQHTHI